MYFSLITPCAGRERDAAYERMSGPYAEHQWLWRFFPGEPNASRDFLFRRKDLDGLPRFYVVSKRVPQTPSVLWQIQTRDYRPQLEPGVRLRFELRANPVVTQSQNGKSARHDVVMQKKKELLAERGLRRWRDWQDDSKPALGELVTTTGAAWLRARGERLGFMIDDASLIVEGYRPHIERANMRFSTVDFSGELTVTDVEAFMGALHKGVGRAKAFGCGLLLIRAV